MAKKHVENFRANLADICAEHGDVQTIADAAGISRVYLSRIIHGHASPSMSKAYDIAKAAGFNSLDELTGGRINLKKLRQTA